MNELNCLTPGFLPHSSQNKPKKKLPIQECQILQRMMELEHDWANLHNKASDPRSPTQSDGGVAFSVSFTLNNRIQSKEQM